MLVSSSILLVVLAIVWLRLGRRITLLLDRVTTVGARSLPVTAIQYEGGGFRIGEESLTFGTTTNLGFDLVLASDAANRVLLSNAYHDFTLGPRTNPVDSSGRPEIDIVAEAGDEVSLTVSRSALPWPTPLEFSILGGSSPWWRRYAYYRLVWKKLSGATLRMTWRYGQRFDSRGGWSAPVMQWDSRTGLLAVDIQPAAGHAGDSILGTIVQYIGRTKGWNRSEYRVVGRGPCPDGKSDVFSVMFLEDERHPHPGAGKSVELYLDRESHRVTRECGWQ
jgi:hypothetical protein